MGNSKKVCKLCGYKNHWQRTFCANCGCDLNVNRKKESLTGEIEETRALVTKNYFKDKRTLQFKITSLLVAFVACVGMVFILNGKANVDEITINEPLDVNDVFTQDFNDLVSSSKDFNIYDLRIEKEKSDAKFIREMKEVVDNSNTAQEQKDIANEALIQKAQMKEMENRVELNVKNIGYEDSLCLINSGRVIIYVKVKEIPSKDEAAVIQKAIQDTTALTDITIETRK